MRALLCLIVCLCTTSLISSQEIKTSEKQGEVTFISSQNLYVKFENTEGIKVGDTLFSKINNQIIPSIEVKFISSSSCAGISIFSDKIKVGDKVLAVVEISEVSGKKEIKTKDDTQILSGYESDIKPIESGTLEASIKSKIYGRVSISSYSNFSNINGRQDFQRWRYLVSFNADHINSSPISMESYINFSYRADEWTEVQENLTNALRIYSLAVKYEFNDFTHIWLGRRINSKIANLSSIDGLQFETKFNDFYTGLVVGSRPNFNDFSYNIKLFEYGGFIGRIDTAGEGVIQNSLGIFEQTNNFKTDRRYLYFQHNNNIVRKLNWFVSSEADLFKRKNGANENTISLTSFFVSARYSPSRWINFSTSYNARKNVIYYETFKSFADSLLESETRQGLRFRVNLRPVNNFFVGLNYGYRFRRGELKPTNNYSGSLTYSRIPYISLAANVSLNLLNTSYVEGTIVRIRLNKDFLNGSFNAGAGYRNVNYKFTSGAGELNQDILSVNLSLKLIAKIFLSVSHEGIYEDSSSYSRFYINLTSRF